MLAKLDPMKGSLRSYLRGCVDHFALKQNESARRLKRGGPAPADGGGVPSDVFALGRVLEDVLLDQRLAPLVAIAARASTPDVAGRN